MGNGSALVLFSASPAVVSPSSVFFSAFYAFFFFGESGAAGAPPKDPIVALALALSDAADAGRDSSV